MSKDNETAVVGTRLVDIDISIRVQSTEQEIPADLDVDAAKAELRDRLANYLRDEVEPGASIFVAVTVREV